MIRPKPKPKYLTCKEIRKFLLSGEKMPTAIFFAKKTDYIVKPHTFFSNLKKENNFKLTIKLIIQRRINNARLFICRP